MELRIGRLGQGRGNAPDVYASGHFGAAGVRCVEHAQWASPAHRNRSVPAGAAFVIASLIRFAHRLARETRALGAVEFAMTAPFLILLYVGGFQLMDAISAYRKVTVTTRSLADLTSRQETMTDAKAIEFMNAARQVMAPYSPANVDIDRKSTRL